MIAEIVLVVYCKVYMYCIAGVFCGYKCLLAINMYRAIPTFISHACMHAKKAAIPRKPFYTQTFEIYPHVVP